MSQSDEVKSLISDIQVGLKMMGADRVVALSVHKSNELIAELEVKAAKLAEQLGAA